MSTISGEQQGAGAPPAGWYADTQTGGQRWWDGQQWTEHTQPAPAAVVTPAYQASPTYGTTPTYSATPTYGTTSTYGTTPGYGGAAGYPGAQTTPYGTSPTYGGPATYGQPGAYGPGPTPKNTPALVGFILSVLAVSVGALFGTWFGSLIVVLLCANGLKTAKSLESQGYPPVGRALSIWGLCLAVLSFVIVIVARVSSL